MQKITVEISARGYTGLTAENIENALYNYFGSSTLKVSFSVTEAAQQSVQPTGGESTAHQVLSPADSNSSAKVIRPSTSG